MKQATQGLQNEMENEAAGSLLALIGAQQNKTPKPATHCESPVPTVSDDGSFSSNSSVTSTQSNEVPAQSKTKVKKSGAKTLFPTILMTVLTDPSNSDIITFLPNGMAFVILQPEVFESRIMPKHFRMDRISSFTRKLKRWGFQQVLDQVMIDREIYKHPLFRRGKWAMCRKMKCLKDFPSRVAMTEANSRSSSPPSQGAPQIKLSPPLQNPPFLHVNVGRRTRDGLFIDQEIQNQLALSSALKDQLLNRHSAMATPILPQHQQTNLIAAAPIPQEVVDKATDHVVGAALEVLVRDKEHTQNDVTLLSSSMLPSAPRLEQLQANDIVLASQLGVLGQHATAPSILHGLGAMVQDFPVSVPSQTIGGKKPLLGAASLLQNQHPEGSLSLMGLY